jgi:hypothetical protein
VEENDRRRADGACEERRHARLARGDDLDLVFHPARVRTLEEGLEVKRLLDAPSHGEPALRECLDARETALVDLLPGADVGHDLGVGDLPVAPLDAAAVALDHDVTGRATDAHAIAGGRDRRGRPAPPRREIFEQSGHDASTHRGKG